MKSSLWSKLPITILVILGLMLAACAAPAAPAPSIEELDTASESSDDADTEEESAEESDEEAEEETDENQEIVDESEASQAEEVEAGVTVASDEEVESSRENYGGRYLSVSLDENTLEYIPNMAESYSISEDGLVFTFNLRQTIEWSDGTSLTANDFAWSYEQAIDPDNGFPYVSQLAFITGYEALDDYTLQITIDEVYAPALGQMSGLITPLPQHIWEDLDWADPETNPEINSPTVVSGPYKLKEWKRDQYAIFEANENYWYHGAPNMTETVEEIVPDQDIAYEKLKSGESDNGSITPENLEEARELDNVTVYEWWPAAAVWHYIGLNMREGYVTSDVNIRHGLAYAVDKQLITDEVMLGQGQRLCSVFPETSWVYNPDVPCYEYNIDDALASFEKAGYTLEDDKLVDADGEQLSLRLLYGPNEVGIDVQIEALEWASFLEATNAEEPDWDIFLGAWRATIEPHIMYTIWAEDSIPQLNSVAYINKDVEQLFTDGGATYDTEVRRTKYQEAQMAISEEAPYIFMFYQKSWSGQNNRIQGIDPKPLGIGWNYADWFIEADSGE